MASSKITKKALANALKELMIEMPFQKISVGKIAEKCNMNRKSFYYHFKDKYDLVNWIFDTEFLAVLKSKYYKSAWDVYEDLLTYFYENRAFYRKALKMTGQNSFSEHFKERLRQLFTSKKDRISADEKFNKFYTDFFADAFVCSIERWLLDKNCIQPVEFVRLLRASIEKSAIGFYNHINIEEKPLS